MSSRKQSATAYILFNRTVFGICLDLVMSIFGFHSVAGGGRLACCNLSWLRTRWWFSLVPDPSIHAPWSVLLEANGGKRKTDCECDTCVLRLTRVLAQPQASKSVTHVCFVFHATAYALILAQVCKHRLLSVLPNLDCSCRSDHVVVDWSCWKLPHRSTGRIRSSARMRVFPFSTCDPDT